MANPLAKTVKPEDAYEVWQSGDWTWYVLKFYQTYKNTVKNEYGRVFCKVVSPWSGPNGDLGDVYYREITAYGRRVKSRHSENLLGSK